MADVDKVDDEVEADVASDAPADEAEQTDADQAGPADAQAPQRSAEVEAFWEQARIDAVEIALPAGVGYTLRAYRSPDQVVMSELDREEDDFTILERSAARTAEDEKADPLAEDDDFDDEAAGPDADERASTAGGTGDEAADDDAASEDTDDEADEPEESDEDDEDEAADLDEVPVFLGHGGRLYLFRTPQALVDFVASDAPHELTQLDTWAKVREELTAERVVADEADRYELDLVVDNLRGGADVWDADLIIHAGEVARDLGYALRMDAVLTALAPGSPLDDLDEALRASGAGGFGGFRARRRLKKIGAQQAALGWRTIIGKISAVVDWRD